VIHPDTISQTIAEALPELAVYFADGAVTEISINPGGALYVENAGVKCLIEGVKIEEDRLVTALKAVATVHNQDAIGGTKTAIVNGTYGGMRVAGALSPVGIDGSFLTIRKHLAPEKRPTLKQLIEWEALTQKQADLILHAFTVADPASNILIVGATGSGKTTYANALLKQIPKHQRVVTIEEVEELSSMLPNLIRVLTSNTAEIAARDLIKGALRWFPDRIIVGESRGEETFDIIRAFNSGHPGSLTTVHASSARLGLDVVEMLYQMSLPENASITTDVVRKYIAGAIQMVIYVNRTYVPMPNGTQKSVRRVKEIFILKRELENGEYCLEDWSTGELRVD
jgi:pilus assembly protein CpaF